MLFTQNVELGFQLFLAVRESSDHRHDAIDGDNLVGLLNFFVFGVVAFFPFDEGKQVAT